MSAYVGRPSGTVIAHRAFKHFSTSDVGSLVHWRIARIVVITTHRFGFVEAVVSNGSRFGNHVRLRLLVLLLLRFVWRWLLSLIVGDGEITEILLLLLLLLLQLLLL